MKRSLLFILSMAAILVLPDTGFAQSLRSAVRDALTTNPALHAATDDARASAFDLLKLQSEFQPTVSLYGEGKLQRVDDPVSLSASDNNKTKFGREVGLNAEYVVFDGARRANLVYANAARVDGSIFRLLDASETLALNATEVYIDAYRHHLLLHAAQSNLERHRQIGRQVMTLVSGGRLPVSDRLQIQDRIRAAELVVVDLERRLRDADARFERIVGRKRTGSLSVPNVPPKTKGLDALQAAAVRNSFRVRIAGIEIDRAGYERDAGEADRKPRVSLNAGVRYGEDLEGVTGRETDSFVGLRMNWTLYKGGRDARTKAANARRNKAISERHVAIREVRELAHRTWNGYLANQDRARLLDIQFAVNRRLVQQYLTEFEAGTRTLLEVLEVERATFEVEFEKISAQASLAFSQYRLLAVKSQLAAHFGVQAAGMSLTPDFEARAKADPTSVFNIDIPSLDRADDR